MKKTVLTLITLILIGIFILPKGTNAEEGTKREGIKPPTKSQEQGLNYRNTIPKNFETHIAAQTAQDKERVRVIIDLYKMLETDPTPENLLKYVSDTYIQHNTLLPDGANPIALMFAASVAQYPVKLDIHKIIVSGDWAMVHVNFRNLNASDPSDLGISAVDMYYFGSDGRVEEHWDALQTVPTHSGNPHGMFLKVYPYYNNGDK